jgi:hypothetical protein
MVTVLLTREIWYRSYFSTLNLGDSASKCVPDALTHELMVAVPHSMFQVLWTHSWMVCLKNIYQFFLGQKDWAVQRCFIVHFCKILNYTFHFTSCLTCFIAPGKKLIIDGIFVLLHIQGHVSLILMDLTRLQILAAVMCVWHLSLPLINRGSQNDVLSNDCAAD